MIKSRSKYVHIRVSSPKGTVTCRTHDIGRKGHSKRIACLKKSGKWKTQAFLVSKKDIAVGDPHVRKFVHGILYRHPRAKVPTGLKKIL
jgi:hypothetical protein